MNQIIWIIRVKQFYFEEELLQPLLHTIHRYVQIFKKKIIFGYNLNILQNVHRTHFNT